ncbi:hypothetical protein K437DRAFT_258444 [Tilletiaria anomala UBC 951]|uniref:DUF952-domain-containing protein n=1 Tax=Tilletiaria anomala (strain ATCC 24038 / CBS 436.72 / UBC 951) TaxID=1037660 RepID=A0A066VLA5_TILAU|nr:uncharacterized protein K437DRAFT_258444 [Tilletiaria anomala UBC 951]KDN41083.1 hypothetical protein K437DRAFT_258444 [Tilletiaria anomala UBC 951]
MSSTIPDPETCTYLYKILTPAESDSLPETAWHGTPLDVKDEFIHLSNAHQLVAVLQKWFSKTFVPVDTLYLHVLPRSAIRRDQTLQFDSVGDTKFGHIYGEIDPKTQFEKRIEIHRKSDGSWGIPELPF